MAASILIIDDAADVRDWLSETLADAGYRVQAMPTGKAAVGALVAGMVDLIMTDVYMPDMGGIEVLRTVRRIAPGVPVLMMSGHGNAEFNARPTADLLGAAGWLTKPFSNGTVVQAVRDALAAKAA